MMRELAFSMIAWVFPIVAVASAGQAGVRSAERIDVFVSIPPQAYVVEQVGGRCVRVGVLVRPGQEPHTFEATPRQIMSLARARVYFTIGVPFEDRLVAKIRTVGRELTIVDMTKDVKKRMMTKHSHDDRTTHTRHAGDDRRKREHDHKGRADPHVWLSPPLIRIQARNVAEALIDVDPARKNEYEQNLSVFLKAVDKTHAAIAKALKPYKGRSFHVFHPAFGYFADAYGLEQVAVEAEGKSPTPKELARLIRRAKAENVKILFVQPQFARKSAQAVASAIGGTVAPMDPLAKDVLKNLETMAAKIVDALRSQSLQPAGLRTCPSSAPATAPAVSLEAL